MKMVFLLREDKSGIPINSHSGFVLTSIKYELDISDNLLKHSKEVMFFTFGSILFSISDSLVKDTRSFHLLERSQPKRRLTVVLGTVVEECDKTT